MLAYIPYMDPMGFEIIWMFFWNWLFDLFRDDYGEFLWIVTTLMGIDCSIWDHTSFRGCQPSQQTKGIYLINDVIRMAASSAHPGNFNARSPDSNGMCQTDLDPPSAQKSWLYWCIFANCSSLFYVEGLGFHKSCRSPPWGRSGLLIMAAWEHTLW